MPLVSAKDFTNLLRVNNIPVLGNLIGFLALYLTHLRKVNKVYDKNSNKKGLNYLNALLNEYEIKFHISKSDIDKIPRDGAFISISNHPLGGVDGILLLKTILEKREDYKVIANFLLQKQEPIASYILPVNPFDNRKDVQSSIQGIRASLTHLKEGKPLGVFPAGEVSTLKEGSLYVDKPWDKRAIKIIKKANVPVLPIYFYAKNSKLFYILSKISPVLRTLKLPSELGNKKGKVIHIKVGEIIPFKEISKIKDLEVLTSFLRERTYLLSKTFLRKKRLIRQYKKRLKKKIKQVALPKNNEEILKEIDTIRSLGKRLFESNEYEVFFTKSAAIPNLMIEIGRLREITFRLIGEGTNKKCDTDKYDLYYHHLILWNREAQKFVGAYRMGLGDEIFRQKGFKGFYISKFFKFSSEMDVKLSKTIEMGRAFIVPEFQQKSMPLFLLWRGIAAVTVKYPQYEYLMGGATISNLFSDYAKSAMMYCLDTYYVNNEVKDFISSKKPFKIDLTKKEKGYIDSFIGTDVKKLDKLIRQVENDKLRMPVLIKQYVKQNAKFVAYNIDKNFNDAIDALIFMKVKDIPQGTIAPFLKNITIEN